MKSHQPVGRSVFETAGPIFLPSFCDVRMVFSVVVIAELLAFILTLVSNGVLDNPWANLGLVSVFMQWIALTSAALLCVCRPLLQRLGNSVAALVSYLLVLLVTAIISELAFWLIISSTLFPDVGEQEHAVFLLRNLIISTVIAAVILRYLYVQFQWRQQLEAESRARIQALQARIRPHFLFNSMNTIAALTRSSPQLAESAIEDLSDLFRASISSSEEKTTLADELTLANRYLNIECLRLGERLSVQWNIDRIPQHVSMPPLILQPLLENAIYHGIERLSEGGTIHIDGSCQRGKVEISISNPLPETEAGWQREGNGIARENIRQRLQLAFGGRTDLLTSLKGNRYRVVIRFPEVSIA
jgi:two-component system sensor histidine kinase AlgZ